MGGSGAFYATSGNFRILYEIDDLVFHEDIPDYNKFKTAFVDPKIRQFATNYQLALFRISTSTFFLILAQSWTTSGSVLQ